ncbi:hypothetical protein Franean1_6277 [Parafrankia sp. EAN1pec]|uniref:hypothetical protein n=1 Tax=Parafrankia sp. (strain EAN1pec) TaxID=298653 RepID=UPI000054135B|nr:hypothetical protein Franean1_6277 [Frankia sp. EAN1pec]
MLDDFEAATAGRTLPAGYVLDAGVLGVDLAAARARVAAYAQTRELLRARLVLALSPAEFRRLDVHLRRLPVRGAVALMVTVAGTDAAGLERLRAQLAPAPPGRWGAAVHLVDAARRAAQPRDHVAVPAHLSRPVRVLLAFGAEAHSRASGGSAVLPGLPALLEELRTAGVRHDRGLAVPPPRFQVETAPSGPSMIGREPTEGTPTEWVSASDYARRARITRQAATRQAREGRAPARMVGGRWLILTDLEPDAPAPDPDQHR